LREKSERGTRKRQQKVWEKELEKENMEGKAGA
jgi:hypothetical protein